MDRTTSPDTEKTADVLNSLLRGEISAAETYRQAIEKLEKEARPEVEKLRALRTDHVDAANLLRRHVSGRGEESSTSSGAWGAFAKAVEGTSKLFGNAAAVKALKEGEEHGTAEYDRALKNKDLDAGARKVISDTILPKQRAHVGKLDSILSKV